VAINNKIEEPPFLVDEPASIVDNWYYEKEYDKLPSMFFTCSPCKISGTIKKFNGKYAIPYIKFNLIPFIYNSSYNET